MKCAICGKEITTTDYVMDTDANVICDDCAYEYEKRYDSLVHHALMDIDMGGAFEKACFKKAFIKYMKEVREWEW